MQKLATNITFKIFLHTQSDHENALQKDAIWRRLTLLDDLHCTQLHTQTSGLRVTGLEQVNRTETLEAD